MKRCVAYCRVSSDKEDQTKSFKNQKQQWIDIFQEDGYNPAKCGLLYRSDGSREHVEGIFADEGITGTSVKRREAFKFMLECARRREFDIIYVEDVSRFTRSVEDGTKVIKDLKELGVEVYFRKEDINSFESVKEFELNLRMMLVQEESRIKSDRLKWGIHKFHMKGGWNSGSPYGYDVVDGMLQINKDEAKYVKDIFNMYLNEGCGIYKIARFLNLNGITTKKGLKWSQKQLATMLENPLYTGVQRTHTKETIDINRKITVEIDPDEQIIHIRPEIRIIDDETFKAVQLERQKRNDLHTHHAGHSNKHLLSSLLYCEHCGGNYKRKKRHTYSRKDGTSKDIGYEWTCAINDMYGKSRCPSRVAVIETDVIDRIKEEIKKLKTDNYRWEFETYLRVKFNYEVSDERVKELHKKRETKKKELDIIRQDLAEGMSTREQYKEQAKDINAYIGEIDNELRKIEQHDRDVENAKLKYKQFLQYVRDVDIENLNNATLKKIFRNIIVVKTDYGDGTKDIELDFNYNFLDMSFTELFLKKTGSYSQ